MNILKAKRLPRKQKKALMKNKPLVYLNWKCRKQIADILEYKNMRILKTLLANGDVINEPSI